VSDHRDLSKLKSQLDELPRQLRTAIAARTVLRVLPLIQFAIPTSGKINETLEAQFLSVFQGVAIAWIASGAYVSPDRLVLAARSAAATLSVNMFEDPPADAAQRSVAEAVRGVAYIGGEDGNIDALAAAIQDAGLAGQYYTSYHGTKLDVALMYDYGDIRQRGQRDPTFLAKMPLWPRGESQWVRELWQPLRIALMNAPGNWEVWTTWYDDRLDGRVQSVGRETAYVNIPDEIWARGPIVANAEIIKRIEEHEPPPLPPLSRVPPLREHVVEHVSTVPAQRPAAVEPIWQSGILSVPKKPAKTDLSGRKFSAALRSLGGEARSLANDLAGEANIDKRFISFLNQLSERIPPKAPSQDQLFGLGHFESVLEGYAKTVHDQWPDVLAARYRALAINFDRTMRQSSLWREFKRNAAKEILTPEQIAAAAPLAKETAAALRQDDAQEFIDPNLPQAIERLADLLTVSKKDSAGLPVEVTESGKELLAIDLIESVNNTLKPLAEAAVSTAAEAGTEYAKGVKKGLVRAAKRQGPKDGEKLFKWLRRVAIVSVAGGLAHLLAKFPDAFGWLMRLPHL
jgi:hypothetical protein